MVREAYRSLGFYAEVVAVIGGIASYCDSLCNSWKYIWWVTYTIRFSVQLGLASFVLDCNLQEKASAGKRRCMHQPGSSEGMDWVSVFHIDAF